MSYTSDINKLKDDVKKGNNYVRSISYDKEDDTLLLKVKGNYLSNVVDFIKTHFNDKLEIIESEAETDFRGRFIGYIWCNIKFKKYGIDLEIEELESKLKKLKQKRKEEVKKEKVLIEKQRLLKEIEELENK